MLCGVCHVYDTGCVIMCMIQGVCHVYDTRCV